ncbi:MAG: hypothetical protein J6D28_03320 [Bacilli bacterium]|nr:hypothetical protein [Bacilli bacterium]
MRNAIMYYYGLNPVELHQVGKVYKFKINYVDYIMEPYNRSMDEVDQIYSLHLSLLNGGYYCHHIVLNSGNDVVTVINDIPYILMKVLVDNRRVLLEDIVRLNNIYIDEKNFLKLRRNDWYSLWINKIDYIEYQISQFGKKYPLIRESSDYFIGIVENCISLLSNLNIKSGVRTVCHNRINDKMTLHDLYSPLNFIIDNRVRDVAEFFKVKLLSEDFVIDDLKSYFFSNKLTNDELVLFFIRVFYPSFYFDVCDGIINHRVDESELSSIIDVVDVYERNIIMVYNYIRTLVSIPDIEWLIKM